MIRMTIPIEPRGQKRFRAVSINGRAGTYKDAAQSRYEGQVSALIAQYRPAQPLAGALRLTVAAYLPIPRSKPKRWQQAARDGLVRPTGKPDGSNLLKNIEDIMNGVYWGDDAQIVDARVSKFYGDNPRWEIEIEEA